MVENSRDNIKAIKVMKMKNINTLFITAHKFNLLLSECNYRDIEDVVYDLQSRDVIIIADQAEYQRLNMVWRCITSKSDVRNFFKNLLGFDILDVTWDEAKDTVYTVLRDDIYQLCTKGFTFTANDKTFFIDEKIYPKVAMIIDCQSFKTALMKCYKEDTSL